MNPYKFCLHLIGFGLLWASLSFCAKPASPSGGPRDDTPPKVSHSYPEVGQLNHSDPVIKIWFDEAIRKPAYGKEIFISPLLQKRPKLVLSDNAKRLKIKFEEILRHNTTYVIMITEVADHNAGNKMKESFTLAFSTGAQLDSLSIEGQIISPVIGEPVSEMTVLLFDADSVNNNQFFGQSPAYVTKTNEQGFFTFSYLRNSPFQVLGLDDKDQSNSYSSPAERIAISLDSIVAFTQDSLSSGLQLYSFVPDQRAPRLRNYIWYGENSLIVKFSENLKLDSATMYLSDTLGQGVSEISTFEFFPGEEPELMLKMDRPRGMISDLRFLNVTDSLGNRLDTILRVEQNKMRALENPLPRRPALDLVDMSWKAISYRAWEESDNDQIFLTDTNRIDSLRKRLDILVESQGYDLQIRPQESLAPGPYILHIDGTYFSPEDSMPADTIYRYSLKWPDPEEYGTLSGSVKIDSSLAGPVIVEFLKDKKVARRIQDTTFAFTMMEAGSYQVRVILDQDGNGLWTTGRIWPPTIPERILMIPEPVKIRENWDFEDYLIEVKLPEIAQDTLAADAGK